MGFFSGLMRKLPILAGVGEKIGSWATAIGRKVSPVIQAVKDILPSGWFSKTIPTIATHDPITFRKIGESTLPLFPSGFPGYT